MKSPAHPHPISPARPRPLPAPRPAPRPKPPTNPGTALSEDHPPRNAPGGCWSVVAVSVLLLSGAVLLAVGYHTHPHHAVFGPVSWMAQAVTLMILHYLMTPDRLAPLVRQRDGFPPRRPGMRPG